MSRPVRVLFFDHTAELGGAEIALADLVQHLDRARVEPTVLLGSAGPLQKRIENTAPVHILAMDADLVKARRDSLGLRSLSNFSSVGRMCAYVLRLRRFIRQHRPDLFHTNSLKSAVLGGVAGRLAGTPVIWHIRDRISGDYLPRNAARAVRLLARFLPTFIVANSEATLQTLDVPGTPSAVVPSGVDLSRFSAKSSDDTGGPRDPEVRVVGLIGRICPWKGQHVFVEAAAAVHSRYPKVRFQIIGAALFTDQPYEQQIREMIEERGLTDVIELTGFRSDVDEAIRSLDIVVHASVLGEPFGQVIVQGMACRKPVIATNGGGVPEIVVDGETGLLVPMGDASAMAEAIGRLVADDATARRMGESGFRRVAERFTIGVTADKLTAIYERLARGEAGTRAAVAPPIPDQQPPLEKTASGSLSS